MRHLQDVHITDGATIASKRRIQVRARKSQFARPRFYLHQAIRHCSREALIRVTDPTFLASETQTGRTEQMAFGRSLQAPPSVISQSRESSLGSGMVEGGSLVGNESANVLSIIFSRTCRSSLLSMGRYSGSRLLPWCSLTVLSSNPASHDIARESCDDAACEL